MKHVLALAALVFAASCFGQVPDYVPTDGLVAWYPFDGSLIDASGMVGEGVASETSFGSDRWSNEGSALQVVSGSFANLGMQGQLALSPEDNLTIAMWSHPDSQEGINVTKYQNGNGSGSSWFVLDGLDGGVRVFGNGTSGTPNEDEWYQTCPNVTDGWSHIVVVFEGGSVTLVVNGTLMCETTLPVSTSTQSQPVLVGRSNCTSGSSCNHSEGRIDDLGFWNRALSSEEALQLFLGAVAVHGCMDSQACNFNPEANVDDGSCTPSGCMDSQACNFNPEAECHGEACDYTCCPGPGCCSIGHYWDWDLEKCFDIVPSDTDFDGCVSMTDLLDLLTVFGTCNEIPWSCGDPLEYQGYSYETVQIGDQCWFAENLRAENYSNGDPVEHPTLGVALEDVGYSLGFGSDGWWCTEGNQNFNSCDSEVAVQEFGRHYNGFSSHDERGLCPTGWRVPNHADWFELAETSGGQESAGQELKAAVGWNNATNGTDSFGWNAKPAGTWNQHNTASFQNSGSLAWWWSTSMQIDGLQGYVSIGEGDFVYVGSGISMAVGASIRCIQDPE